MWYRCPTIGAAAIAVCVVAIHAETEQPAIHADLTRGLIGHWTFDGHTGDSSGLNHHGQAVGPIEYVDGVHGKAARFFGAEKRGYVLVPNAKTLDTPDELTLALWARIDSEAGQTGMDCSGRVIKHAHQMFAARSGDRVGWVVYTRRENLPNRHLAAECYLFGPQSRSTIAEIDDPLSRWMHITAIIGSRGTKLYLDGELIASDDRAIDLTPTNNEPIYLGIQAGKGSCLPLWFPLDGALDDVRLYNRALCQAEINALSRAGR